MTTAIIDRLGLKRQNSHQGFTLIELLISMVIATIVGAAVYKAYEYQIKSSNTQRAVVESHQNARAAMYYMTNDIRMAGYDPTGRAGAGITDAAADTIVYTMDTTGGEANGEDDDGDLTVDNGETYDGEIADPPGDEQTIYAFVNNTIERNGVILAENINALNFTYLDEDDLVLALPVANPGNIRKVRINVVAATAGVHMGMNSTHNGRTIAMTSEVKVRNRVFW